MKIGVFDSGAGGKRVAATIRAALPEHEIIYRNDREHVPYGMRPAEEVYGFVAPIFRQMLEDGCQVIVVACNTVTTTLIGRLRDDFDVPFVAVEPMVKPAAALTKSNVIAVCATPATLNSPRYRVLKEEYAKQLKVLEPDCSDWALHIEEGRVSELELEYRIEEVLDQGADVIVLGCTHYHWIEDEIAELAKGRAVVLQPEEAIVRRLKQVIARLT